jgi:hypothetical protein
MMDITEINTRIEILTSEIQCREIELRKLRLDKGRYLSREFIRVNGIKASDVQLSSGNGVPHFGHVQKFTEWLAKTRCTKPYAEWNTLIHLTSNLLGGRFQPTPATIDHLENCEV